MDLFQMSPDFAKNARHASTRVNNKKKRSAITEVYKYTRFRDNDKELGSEYIRTAPYSNAI